MTSENLEANMRAELSQVRKQIATLRDELNKIHNAMREYKKKRDELNEKVRALSAELREVKKLRDEHNQ